MGAGASVDKLWTTSKIQNNISLMRATKAEEATVPKSISVDAENPRDSATMFSLRIDDVIVGRGLTAAQAHLLVGEILERVTLPQRKERRAGRIGPPDFWTVEPT